MDFLMCTLLGLLGAYRLHQIDFAASRVVLIAIRFTTTVASLTIADFRSGAEYIGFFFHLPEQFSHV
jgi:hypothetical protein